MTTNTCPISNIKWTETKVILPQETLDKLVSMGIESYTSVNDIILSQLEKLIIEYENQK